MMKKLSMLILITAVLLGCGGGSLISSETVDDSGVLPIVVSGDELPNAAGSMVEEPMSSGNGMMGDRPDENMISGSGSMADNEMIADSNMIEGIIDRVGSAAGEMLSGDEVLADGHVDVGSGDEGEAALAVSLATGVPEIAGWLANYPDWTATTWEDEEDGRFYNLDLYSEAEEEWLGWVAVNVADEVVADYFVPRDLTPEEFQVGRDKVEAFVFDDEAILARLEDIESWEYDSYYNRWDAMWEVYLWRGLEELTIVVGSWEDQLYLEEIYNPLELEAMETAENNENMAISLAWQAEGIDQALADSDNWQTYVSQQGETVYAVSFATKEGELFYALVDVASEQVLESVVSEQ